MALTVRIGLVGDYHRDVRAHQAIPLAFALASDALGLDIIPQWLPTENHCRYGLNPAFQTELLSHRTLQVVAETMPGIFAPSTHSLSHHSFS